MSADATGVIARRAAGEVFDGALVNLGIGIPLMIPGYLDPGVRCIVHQESGYVGMGPSARPGEEDPTITDAAGNRVTMVPGASCFDSAVSFALVRGGRLDIAFLGALEVDAQGNLANWIIPGKWQPGMGGGMELAQKARKVVVTMRHTDKHGRPKILEQCKLPLTAARAVDVIITDLAVFEVHPSGLLLTGLAEGVDQKQVAERTEARFSIVDNPSVFSDH
ncbi:MAG TPA: 3-oxoacid CoA-transferase subunit B [Arenicellales bacterium]|nr:3-oxoacid CoA-transferase subunit B [Arenicellales bacterium]